VADRTQLSALPREAGHARGERREGFVPAVLYGKDVTNETLRIPELELRRALAEGAARGLLSLDIEKDGQVDNRVVMIRDIQTDPVRRRVIHVDLYQVNLAEKITTEVGIRLLGEEQATQENAIVQHQLREISVKCLPTAIPDALEVNISDLKPGDSATVADVFAPEGVEILNDPTDVIVSIVLPRVEVEEPEPEAEEEVAGLAEDGEAEAEAGEEQVDQETPAGE